MRRIVSGGQTGADRAALDFAVRHRVPYGGWCPRGGWAEDRPRPPGLLADFPLLKATRSADPAVRTRLNVRDSAATVVLADRRGAEVSPGTMAALAAARRLGRPHVVLDVGRDDVARSLRAFLAALPGDARVNVAGGRESESPGLHAASLALLERCRGEFGPPATAAHRIGACRSRPRSTAAPDTPRDPCGTRRRRRSGGWTSSGGASTASIPLGHRHVAPTGGQPGGVVSDGDGVPIVAAPDGLRALDEFNRRARPGRPDRARQAPEPLQRRGG